MARVELAVRGARVVTSGSEFAAPVAIAGGKVVQIGGEFAAERDIDATGCLLLPGGIDAHVHLTNPGRRSEGPRWVDDFTSGSAAALAGGVTTIGNMSFLQAGELPLAGLEREGAIAREQTMADVFLHPVISEINPETLSQVDQLLDAGCNTIKYFIVNPAFDQQASGFVELTRRAGANGLLTMIHCEDHAIIDDATKQLIAAGRDSLRSYAESRPIISEVVAVQRAVAIAEATGAPVYVVHLSAARALAVCAEAQARGLPIFVETRPLYLYLTSERYADADGAKYVGQPPLREQADIDALWAGIQQGTVNTVCTDHAPWSLEAKLDPSLSVTKLRPGMENLQTMLPMLYSEGVRTGRISRSRLVEVLSTNVAKLFGLYPRKGTIQVGSDADLVVFDPNLTRTVEAEMLQSQADHSVYQGWQVTGWPVMTLRRGEVVYDQGEVLGQPGSGELVHRAATQLV